MISVGLGLTLERMVSYHQSVKMKSEKAKKTFITALFFGFNLKYVYLFFCVCVCVDDVCVCVGGTCVEVRQHVERAVYLLFTTWVLRVESRSSGLTVSTFLLAHVTHLSV